MSDDATPILNLPYILPNQAQKHVTHNEALRLLDVIVQLSVLARNLAAPPASPAQGDRYIIASGASGAWAGREGQIALFDSGVWQFFAPMAGWRAWVSGEQTDLTYSGSGWIAQADGPLNIGQLGVSATADAVNRLAVSSPATLLNHAGLGHQLKINKSASGDTASLLFQTGYSGRAEMGTTGDDNFSIKVSPDGSAFAVGMTIASATGQVTLPQALRLGGQAADPATPPDGTIWLNTTSGQVKLRSGGQTHVLGQIEAHMLPLFSGTNPGAVPASGGGSEAYLRADGGWAVPMASYALNAAATAPATPLAHMPWMDVSGSLPQLKLRDAGNTAWVPFAQGAGLGVMGRNILINAALVPPNLINQRGFSGNWSALAEGAYGYDRWAKSGTGMRQRIEAGYFKPSTVYTVSGANLASYQVTSPASGHWDLVFPTTATYVQVEEGSFATPFDLRPISYELALCQRYFETGEATANGPMMSNRLLYVSFKVPKRAAPTIVRSAGTLPAETVGTAAINIAPNGFYWRNQSTTSAVGGSWTADAEI